MISRLLSWLQGILGAEDCPIAERGFVVEPDKAALEAARQNVGIYCTLIAPGSRPRAPELAPDWLWKAYEWWLVRHAADWLPQAVLRPVLGRDPLVGPEITDEEVMIVTLVRRIARRALRGNAMVRTMEDFDFAIRAIEQVNEQYVMRSGDKRVAEMWPDLCDATLRTLRSDTVQKWCATSTKDLWQKRNVS
jgi:hypothetical protein